MPKYYLQLRDQLRKMKNEKKSKREAPIVKIEELEKIFVKETKLKEALWLMNEWNECIYFEECGMDIVVVDPEWLAKEMLGKLMIAMRVRSDTRGVIKHSVLMNEVWNRDGLSVGDIETLIGLLHKYGLIFPWIEFPHSLVIIYFSVFQMI